MWADNETDLDLLGFDELVDELVVALTTPCLQPLTVGLLGDWGSGKSSLLKIVRTELERERDGEGTTAYICIEFSPWLYEDYDDVKTAMIDAVLNACRARATTPASQERADRLHGTVNRLKGYARRAGRGVIGAAPAAVPALVSFADPSMAGVDAAAAGALARLAAPAAAAALPDPPAEPQPTDDITDLAAFRAEFGRLVAELDGVEAVVLLIDDVDRCLPDTVADVFETIRLFLNAPKTASVVAASRTIVETAIDSRYPALRREDGRGVGHDYLEKMLQLQVVVPPLSTEQTVSYLNLLIVQLHLPVNAFQALCAELRGRRAADAFAPTFTVAAARVALGDALTPEVEQELSWTSELGAALGFLRGNPRQIKRFMNDLTWRRRAAARRDIDLRIDVLAKLMVLQEQDEADFQTLFDWQLRVTGPPPEIARAEARTHTEEASADPDEPPVPSPPATARRPAKEPDPAPAPDPLDLAVEPWLARPRTRAWLELPPRLGAIDLRPYFSYFRDRLVVGSATAALRPDLQLLVNQLLSEVPAIYRTSLDRLTTASEPDQDAVIAALLDTMLRRPDGPALLPTAELAQRLPRAADEICSAIGRIPHRSVPPQKIPGLALRLGNAAGAAGLLAGWAASSVKPVAAAAAIARRPRAGA